MYLLLLCLAFCGVSAIVRPAQNEEVVGLITFRMVSFSNLEHRLATGEICDNGWFGSRKCDPHFTVCFQQANISLTENATVGLQACDFGGPISCGPFDNVAEIEFGANWCSRPNPFLLNFTKAWNGLDITVRVTEMERGSFLGSNTATGPLIDKFSYVFNGKPSSDTIFKLKLSGTTEANSTLVVEATVQCYPNYYDDHCSTFCTPERNYECDPATGQQLCRAGWSGENCAAKVLSDNLTIHPISALGAQIDEMIVYGEVEEPNTTTTSPSAALLENNTIVVELTQQPVKTDIVAVQPEEIASAHFDKQSGAGNSSMEPKATTSGVTTLRPSTFSSMWPLTVSLVVGGLSYYASTSPSVAPEGTSTSVEGIEPEMITTSPTEATTILEAGTTTLGSIAVAELSIEATTRTVAPPGDPLATVSVTQSSSPSVGTTTITMDSPTTGELRTLIEDPPLLASTTSKTTTTPEVQSRQYPPQIYHIIQKESTGTVEVLDVTVKTESTSTGSAHATTIAPNFLNSATDNNVLISGDGKLDRSTSPTTQANFAVSTIAATTLFMSTSSISPFPDVSDTRSREGMNHSPSNATTASPEMDSMASSKTAKSETVTMSASSSPPETQAATAEVSIMKMNGTLIAPTHEPEGSKPLNNETVLKIVLLENPTGGSWNEPLLGTEVPTQVPTVPSLKTEVTEMAPNSSPAYETTIKDTEQSTLLLAELTTASSAGSTGITENVTQPPDVSNSTSDPNEIPDAGSSLVNVSCNVPFYTFHLPSGERFLEPLASLAFLDQLNSSVGGAIEELLALKNISKEVLHKELKTAVEFTGISLNHTMVVPQVTLYVTLNGSSPLNSSEYKAVWQSALTNMRSNATVTRNPFAITNMGQNYASQHPIMIFLMALLSVAIVILIGIISVLARKPKPAVRTRHRRLSFGEDGEISSSFDNLAFSQSRTSVVPNGEIVSLEPSIYNEVHNAQERLFSRRAAAHAAWKSPMPVTRDLGSTSRTTTTFTREPGSTI